MSIYFYYSQHFFNPKKQMKTKKIKLAPTGAKTKVETSKTISPKTMKWEGWFLFFLSFAGICKFSYITPIKIRKVAYLLLGWESGKKSK